MRKYTEYITKYIIKTEVLRREPDKQTGNKKST